MKKILTIDGGGIKGIFAASFLAEIEKRCGVEIGCYFDLIAGTSTGAIIAAALANGISAQTVLKLYLEKGEKIFSKTNKVPLFTTKYETEPLQTALEEVFGDSKLNECKTRLVIPAFNLQTGETRVFKTLHSKDLYIDGDLRIVDCLLATTAAPLFFEPHEMHGGIYIDGGVGANNPATIALVEGLTRCGWTKDEIGMLSIGGVNKLSPTDGSEKMGIMDALKIQKCFMYAESQYSHNICNIMLPQGQYQRVDYTPQNGLVSLDDVSEKSKNNLKKWGENQAMKYMNQIKQMFLEEKISKPIFFNIKRETEKE